MSLNLIGSDARTFYDGNLFLQIVNENTPAFLKRIAAIAGSQLEGVSLSYGPMGSTSPTSLINRAVFVCGIALSLLTFFLRYRALPSNSVDRRQCLISFVKHSVLLLTAGMAGFHFITAFFALKCFIQFKNAYFVLPHLSDQAPPASRFSRAFQACYTPIKFLFLSAIAKAVFEACNKNFLNGVLFYGLSSLCSLDTEPVKIARKNLEKSSAQVEFAVERSIGSYVAGSLFEVAIISGIGGSIAFKSWPTLISGITSKNIYDFLFGLRGISFGFILYFFDAEHFEYLNDLDLYSFEFVKRFSFAVTTAHKASQTSGVELSDAHFDRTSKLALEYVVKKTHPDKRREMIKKLEKLPEWEKVIYFIENLPLLDAQEKEEFLAVCGIRTTYLCSLLSPEQIQQTFLSPHVAPHLNPLGLQLIANELENLDQAVEDSAKNYLGQENSDILIYREIQEKIEKIREYSSSIGMIAYLIEAVDVNSVKNPKTKEYIQSLKELLVSIKAVSQKLAVLESKVEKYTVEQTQSMEVALGNKGLRESHSGEILRALQVSSSETTYPDLYRLLIARGVKTKYDLVQKELLVPSDSIDQLKDRLIRFLMPAAPSSWMDRATRVAHQTYAFVAVPFFITLQLYAQPWLSTAGLICGIVTALFFSSRLNTRFFRSEVVLMVSTGVLTERELTIPLRFRLIFFDLLVQAQLLLGSLSRFGFIPAFVWGTQLPLRVLTYRDAIRQRLQPA